MTALTTNSVKLETAISLPKNVKLFQIGMVSLQKTEKYISCVLCSFVSNPVHNVNQLKTTLRFGTQSPAFASTNSSY